jgi:hypothetical protein
MYPTGNGVVDLSHPVHVEEHNGLVEPERAPENTDEGVLVDILDRALPEGQIGLIQKEKRLPPGSAIEDGRDRTSTSAVVR